MARADTIVSPPETVADHLRLDAGAGVNWLKGEGDLVLFDDLDTTDSGARRMLLDHLAALNSREISP